MPDLSASLCLAVFADSSAVPAMLKLECLKMLLGMNENDADVLSFPLKQWSDR